MSALRFDVVARDGAARAGRVTVRGRTFETPAFLPVGTLASVKGLSPRDLASLGARIVLANTYHLELRVGASRVARLGGLHRFMGFEGALLTDSGGYQVFSQADRVAIDDEGATFRSHLDGRTIRLTPEEAVRIQADLDSDIAMVLDQPVALPAPAETVREAARRSFDWARRALAWHRAHVDSGQVLFGIVQGATDEALRREQTERLVELDFPGYAVGGLAVGESKSELHDTMALSLSLLPPERPRYVMGIGYPEDIVHAVRSGADWFDCVLPTRHARTGQAFTSRGVVRLRHARLRDLDEPLDPECRCEACTQVPVAYLHHLYRCGEMLGPVLVSRHNVGFFLGLVRRLRRAIETGSFEREASAFLERYGG